MGPKTEPKWLPVGPTWDPKVRKKAPSDLPKATLEKVLEKVAKCIPNLTPCTLENKALAAARVRLALWHP